MDRSLVQALLQDAADQVLLDPADSSAWHRVVDFWRKLDERDFLTGIAQGLAERAPSRGLAGLHRSTFLQWATSDPSFAAPGGKALLEIRPVLPERIMAFAHYQWGKAVVQAKERQLFLTTLIDARLPELLALAGKELLEGAGSYLPRKFHGVKKVALVTPSLGNLDHSPTMATLRHASLLREAGMEVRVFAPQDMRVENNGRYLGNAAAVNAPMPNLAFLREAASGKFDITLSHDSFSLTKRWREIERLVGGFDPDVILFIGLMSPLVSLLHARWPVVGLNIHSMAPLAPLDVWLSPEPCASESLSPWGATFPPVRCHHHSHRVEARPPGQVLDRLDLPPGFAGKSVVLISAGDRLFQEIHGPWATRMVDFLRSRPDVGWLLVGGKAERPASLQELDRSQLALMPHNTDLAGVFQACDIFLNPPRMGGGFSVAEAMAAGLPTLSLAGSDGGDKAGPLALKDEEEFFALLAALIDQPERRRELGALMKRRFHDSLDLTRAAPSLIEACELAISLRAARP